MTGSPRHLNPYTAEMPAIRRTPRHAAEEGAPTFTEQIARIDLARERIYPPLPEGMHSRASRRRAPWWRRAWAWLAGE